MLNPNRTAHSVQACRVSSLRFHCLFFTFPLCYRTQKVVSNCHDLVMIQSIMQLHLRPSGPYTSNCPRRQDVLCSSLRCEEQKNTWLHNVSSHSQEFVIVVASHFIMNAACVIIFHNQANINVIYICACIHGSIRSFDPSFHALHSPSSNPFFSRAATVIWRQIEGYTFATLSGTN